MQLPDHLRAALASELASTPTRDLAAASEALSSTYRSHHGRNPGRPLTGVLDARAYAAYRMPATFAALAASFGEVRARLPNWTPHSLLDVGGGPGTAAWAALGVWPDLQRISVVDREAAMIEIGRALAAQSPSAALRSAEWHRHDMSGTWDVDPADLTVAGYVLSELGPDARRTFVRTVWDRTAGTCVIVEPGPPRGYAHVAEAREVLVLLEAEVVAPVPPSWPCLEHEGDWLHFSERVSRTRLHRTAKSAALSYEDEKYCYLAASRLEPRPIVARVVRQPQIRSGHVRLTLCTSAGVQHLVIPRSRKEAHRIAKDLRWGSAIEVDEAHLFGLDRPATS